ncbi:MAG: tyrosine-type recombinase/integrase, partial [Allosphingosinicella sp.]
MLTNATVKAARAGMRAYKMADAGGLYLFVRPNGRKTWRMKFRLEGREQLLTFGDYPELGLADAREKKDEARAQLRRGEDPRASAAVAEIAGITFEQLARRWHAHRRGGWSDVHAEDVLASLERDVFPAIGALAPDDIKSPKILELLRVVEARGAIETARRLKQRISGIFRFGQS